MSTNRDRDLRSVTGQLSKSDHFLFFFNGTTWQEVGKNKV